MSDGKEEMKTKHDEMKNQTKSNKNGFRIVMVYLTLSQFVNVLLHEYSICVKKKKANWCILYIWNSILTKIKSINRLFPAKHLYN